MDSLTQKIVKNTNNDISKDGYIYKLLVTVDGVTESYFLTKGDYTVGRGDECDIQILENTVSRNHAIIHVEGNGLSFLMDNGSVNETYRNGIKLKKEVMYELASENEIMFGDVMCKYIFETSKKIDVMDTISPEFSNGDSCDNMENSELRNSDSDSLFSDKSLNTSEDIISETDEETECGLIEIRQMNETKKIDDKDNNLESNISFNVVSQIGSLLETSTQEKEYVQPDKGNILNCDVIKLYTQDQIIPLWPVGHGSVFHDRSNTNANLTITGNLIDVIQDTEEDNLNDTLILDNSETVSANEEKVNIVYGSEDYPGSYSKISKDKSNDIVVFDKTISSHDESVFANQDDANIIKVSDEKRNEFGTENTNAFDIFHCTEESFPESIFTEKNVLELKCTNLDLHISDDLNEKQTKNLNSTLCISLAENDRRNQDKENICSGTDDKFEDMDIFHCTQDEIKEKVISAFEKTSQNDSQCNSESTKNNTTPNNMKETWDDNDIFHFTQDSCDELSPPTIICRINLNTNDLMEVSHVANVNENYPENQNIAVSQANKTFYSQLPTVDPNIDTNISTIESAKLISIEDTDVTWMDCVFSEGSESFKSGTMKEENVDDISKSICSLSKSNSDKNESFVNSKFDSMKLEIKNNFAINKHAIRTTDIDDDVNFLEQKESIKECYVKIEEIKNENFFNFQFNRSSEKIETLNNIEENNIAQIKIEKTPPNSFNLKEIEKYLKVDSPPKFREPFVYVQKTNDVDDSDFIDRLNIETNDEILTQRLSDNRHIDLTFSTPDSIYEQQTQQLDECNDTNVISTQIVEEKDIFYAININDSNTQTMTQVMTDDLATVSNCQHDCLTTPQSSNDESRISTQEVDNNVCNVSHSEEDKFVGVSDNCADVFPSSVKIVSDNSVNEISFRGDDLQNGILDQGTTDNQLNSEDNSVSVDACIDGKNSSLRSSSQVIVQNLANISFNDGLYLNQSVESVIDTQGALNMRHNNSIFEKIAKNHETDVSVDKILKPSLCLIKNVDKNTKLIYDDRESPIYKEDKSVALPKRSRIGKKSNTILMPKKPKAAIGKNIKNTSNESVSFNNKENIENSKFALIVKERRGSKKIIKEKKSIKDTFTTMTTRSSNNHNRKKLINIEEVNLQIFDVEHCSPQNDDIYSFSKSNECNINVSSSKELSSEDKKRISFVADSDTSSEVKLVIPTRKGNSKISDKPPLDPMSKIRKPIRKYEKNNIKEMNLVSQEIKSDIDVVNILSRKRRPTDPTQYIDNLLSQGSSKALKYDLSRSFDDVRNSVMIERTRQNRRSSLLSLSSSHSVSGTCQNIIMFSGIYNLLKLQKIVKKLNGEITSDPGVATHLVTNTMRRTVKFICCVARGINIVTSDWLIACQKLQYFIPIDSYILENGCEKFHIDLSMSLECARRSQARFNGILGHYKYVVFVTNNTKPSPKELEHIISYAGGTFVPLSDVHFYDYVNETNVRHICVANEMDLKNRNKEVSSRINTLTERDIDIVSVEFLFAIILEQRHPEVKNYKMKV